MKAADIGDDQILAVVDSVRASGRCWATIVDMQAALPGFPYKVVLAKCRQMINKRRLDGCGCGCRGDFRRIPA